MTHIMDLTYEHEGTEEWVCPICGRTLDIEWLPEFKKTVIVPGDEMVEHSGGKGLVIGRVDAQ